MLHCKTGVRSAEALAALKAAGFKDAVHVQGGVLAWVKQVDPSLPVVLTTSEGPVRVLARRLRYADRAAGPSAVTGRPDEVGPRR